MTTCLKTNFSIYIYINIFQKNLIYGIYWYYIDISKKTRLIRQRWHLHKYIFAFINTSSSALTKIFALTKMYLWRRRCIYEGVWRRCIYEGEDVFMKVSALTKMYLWRRRCIYEGVSADEDVFMKAKMYLWRCQRWRRCIYEGEDVFIKVSALTKMHLWRRRCIHEYTFAFINTSSSALTPS